MEENCASKGVTFIELAIIIYITTDGAANINADLHALAQITQIAFNEYFKLQDAAFPNCANLQEYFQPRNDIVRLKPFGVESTTGIARRPILPEHIWKDVRRHVYKVTAARQDNKEEPIGHAYI